MEEGPTGGLVGPDKWDLLFTSNVARRYYGSPKARQKAFVLVEEAAHTNQEVVDAKYKVLMEYILPLTQ